MCPRNLWDFHAKIVSVFSKKHLKHLQDDSFWFSFFLSSFSETDLNVAVIACFEYLFKGISLSILAKWQSVTLADILRNFSEIPSVLLALFTLSGLIILIPLVLAFGRSNLFLGTQKFSIFGMLGCSPCTEIIYLTAISFWNASEEFLNDKGFLPDDFLTFLLYLCNVH